MNAWGVALLAVVVFAAGAVGTVGSALQARGAAQSAADLGALSAAQVARDLRATGVGAAESEHQVCARARAVVAANGASLSACSLGADRSAVVRASASWPGGEVHRSARAGTR